MGLNVFFLFLLGKLGFKTTGFLLYCYLLATSGKLQKKIQAKQMPFLTAVGKSGLSHDFFHFSSFDLDDLERPHREMK